MCGIDFDRKAVCTGEERRGRPGAATFQTGKVRVPRIPCASLKI